MKAAANLRKHGIRFDIALRSFADPYALTEPGPIEDGEQRWRTLGVVEGYLLLVVAHTVREEDDAGHPIEVIRIISARAADRQERRRYATEGR